MNKKRMYVLLCLVALGLVLPVSAADDPSLVGWWRLDEKGGDTAADSSEYGNNGALMGSPAWGEGHLGGAIQLNGVDQYVEIPHDPILTVDEAVTVMCWFNAGRELSGTSENYQGLIAKGNGPRSYSLYTHVGNNFHFSVGATFVGSTSSGTFALNEWNHVAAQVVDGGHVYWINGEAAGTGGAGTVLPGEADTFPVYLGRSAEGLAARAFLGMIDDARIYNRALTQEEIAVAMLGSASEPIAESPNPASGATDVPYYTDLSWTAGEYAATHNVYFGTSWDDVNAASVGDPLGVLVGEGLAETGLELDSLDFETTYFWRVDEVNSPPDSTIFKGAVWDFVTEPVAYPVAGVVATASSAHEAGTDAVRTVDGSGLNANDEHSTDLGDMWLSNAAETEGVWIQYDLGQVLKLDHVRVWNHNSQTESILGYGIKEALIEISSDGEIWTELKTTEIPQATGFATDTGADVALDGAIAQYVRITALSNYSILGLKQFGFSEVRFYNIPVLAREPNPADGGVSDGAEVVLQWRAGREATEHEVVFSDDEQAVIDGSAVVGMAGLSYDAGTLDLGMSYFWKINAVGDTTYEGDLWSFQTPDALMIDDFEMYKAQEGLRIWEYWIDGFDDQANNGAVVGNGDDAEKSVVYEGGQSMPVAFNNTTASKSEVTRYFDTPVDLTQGNPESLKLQIHGDAPGLVVDGDTITLGASGADLWNTQDEGRFVYKTLTGDGSITAKVESLSDVQAWAKAGVMVRESDGADSVDAYMVTSAQNGLTFQYRLETFAAAVSDTGTRSDAWINNNDKPVWVRVERVGDECNGYISLDGESWEASVSNPQTLLMIPSVKIGLCATSHDNNVSTVAVFSNVTTTGDVTGNWEMVEWGGGASGHPNNDAAPMYLRLVDTSGKEITLDHPDPIATVLQTWDEWTIPLGDLSGINTTKIDSITVGVGSSGVQGKVFVDAIRTAKPYPAATD